MARVGFMGGTFDPVHVGHLACAHVALASLELERVLFVPAGVPSFKRDARIVSGADRLAMIELATAGEERFVPCDIELRREGVTYSVDTLHELTALCPDDEFFFICGYDALATLPLWHRAGELAGLATFVGIPREGCRREQVESALLASPAAFRVAFLDMDPVDVSSTQVRALLESGGDASALVPCAVLDYIEAHGLYGRG